MTVFVVGAFRLDDERFELTGPDGPVAVEPQVFDVLRHLLASDGALVTKEELLDSVWGDRFVSESALTSRIKQARRAIGDDGTAQRVIRTVHGRGYRVVADVEVIGGPGAPAPTSVPAASAAEAGAGRAPDTPVKLWPSRTIWLVFGARQPSVGSASWPETGRTRYGVTTITSSVSARR